MNQDISTNPFADDKLHEECGIFGIWGKPEPRPSSPWACTRSSIAARRRQASPATTANASTWNGAKAWSAIKFSVGGPIDKLKGR